MVVFVHASPAAIPPLAAYYAAQAPDLTVTHVLDDGLLRLLDEGAFARASERFVELIAGAARWYGVRVAMLTCSGLPGDQLPAIGAKVGIPVLKIDDPLADAAADFDVLGVLVTFPPALAQTRALLQRAAERRGRAPVFRERVVGGAYEALLTGDHARHDRLLLQAGEALAAEGVDAIVLSQVSMARVEDALAARVSVPVLASLSRSLPALRAALGEAS